MRNWISKNKLEVSLLVFVLIISAFLRFFKLSEYMTFLGDEGRDALIIKDLLENGNIPFIGPPTSVGNIYLGPLYYYMMAIPMAIFWLNPIAAAGMVALIGVLTVFLVYYLTRIWFGKWGALIASFLYGISFVTVIYSRSSWNPNPAPFFTLLSVITFYKAHEKKDLKWLFLTGAMVASAVQMHYLAMILIPIFGIFWLNEIRRKLNKKVIKNFWSGTLGGILSFVLVMTPLILFDFKHNFLNFRAIATIFTSKDSAVGATDNFKIFDIFFNGLIGRYLGAENRVLTGILAVLILIPIILAIKKVLEKKRYDWSLFSLTIWLAVGLIGLSFYKMQVYDHYLGFLNPVPFILLGGFFGMVLNLKGNFKWLLQFLFLLVILVTAFLNIQKNPLFTQPNNQLEKTQKIAKFVIEKTGNKSFNFALISAHNYDAAYKFYLEKFGHKPELVEVERTSQLFVVCEDSECKPVGHPKQEIAAFGWSKIEEEQNFEGVKVFKLVANPSGKP